MPKLQCNVNSCASYKSGYCCRPSIHVNGVSACTKSETDCKSFAEKTQTQMISGVQYSTPNQCLSVDCDANKCMYNQNHKCSADSICISYGQSGTECASFKQK